MDYESITTALKGHMVLTANVSFNNSSSTLHWIPLSPDGGNWHQDMALSGITDKRLCRFFPYRLAVSIMIDNVTP